MVLGQRGGSGRVPVGVDVNDASFKTVESTGGNKEIKLTTEQLPSHSHTFTGTAHSHGLNSHTHTYNKSGTATGSHTLTTTEIPAHTHNSKTLSGSISFRRYGTSASDTHDIPISESNGIITRQTGITWTGSHAMINVGSKSYTNPQYDQITINATHTHDSVGGGSGHTHPITTTSTSSGTATGNTTSVTQGGTIGNTGSGTSINITQPYITCYMWKRTA